MDGASSWLHRITSHTLRRWKVLAREATGTQKFQVFPSVTPLGTGLGYLFQLPCAPDAFFEPKRQTWLRQLPSASAAVLQTKATCALRRNPISKFDCQGLRECKAGLILLCCFAAKVIKVQPCPPQASCGGLG